jgi:hypothetical protein
MKIIIIVFAFLVFAVSLNAQWESDVRLTNSAGDSYTSHNNAWCIAANGNTIHTVWYDVRDGNYEIYYKRSTDGGVNWGADTRLTNNTDGSYCPSIAVSGSVVHVVWDDYRDGNYEIYYKRSIDSGVNWGADTRLTNNTAGSENPSIAVSGSIVHTVWTDDRNGRYEIYYKRSTDGGVTWGADTQLTNYTGGSQFPSIAVSGSIVHTVWWDFSDGNAEIYYKRSTDGGVSWGTVTRLTNNNADSWFPSIAVSGSVVHTVWNDNRDGNAEIYYKRSTDGGVSWGTDTRLTNYTAGSLNPSIAVSGSIVHTVWQDSRDGNYEIYYKRSTDGGVNWGTDTRLTNNTAYSENPSIAVSGSIVQVVWEDNRNANDYEIYYKRNPTGNVGIQNISTEIPSAYSLLQNYPNPFNPTTNIKFDVARVGDVKIAVYDAMGREVQTLVNKSLNPGTYETSFDASQLTSGIYFYKIVAGNFVETRKMMMIK